MKSASRHVKELAVGIEFEVKSDGVFMLAVSENSTLASQRGWRIVNNRSNAPNLLVVEIGNSLVLRHTFQRCRLHAASHVNDRPT